MLQPETQLHYRELNLRMGRLRNENRKRLINSLTHQPRQNSPLEILALRVDLSLIMERPQFSHQVSGVLCCIHSQRLRDDEK